ncbi:bifunctional hydroxymethylpyrimidine kinase/phosphomethylpyrimidine kinase [Niveibacterium terrae]|uniref:bifunctional hydroxymethylpyrimidine kinase/phosphomethylpyrimidine kinase n=1 Tax=Niveibacterium terrae TaxID=3373598 RepID=UPI003A91DB4C
MPNPCSVSQPPAALCFGASDPTGASGIQADLLTLAACGVHPLSVPTSLAARDTRGLETVWALEIGQIDEQARVLLEDLRISAFKVGHLLTAASVAVLAEIISDYPEVPLVLAPAPGASDDEDLPDALLDLLLPLSSVLCCNEADAALLAEASAPDEGRASSPAACARELLARGAGQVLITGGASASQQLIDTLYGPQGVQSTSVHDRHPETFLGAGSTLSAAITAYLARGFTTVEAVKLAGTFTQTSLAAGFSPGMGGRIPWRGRSS